MITLNAKPKRDLRLTSKLWAALLVAGALLIAVEVNDVTVSDRFAQHVERLEGFRARAYKDTRGLLTIGFGHRIRADEFCLKDAFLTRDEALTLLRLDVVEAEAAVNRLVKVPLKQEQFDALVSFTFNVGQGNLATSTLLRKLNEGHCCAVPDELRRWKRGGTASLLARRNAEIALYIGDV